MLIRLKMLPAVNDVTAMLLLLMVLAIMPFCSTAWTIPSSSQASAFTGDSVAFHPSSTGGNDRGGSLSSLVMYDSSHDPPHDGTGGNRRRGRNGGGAGGGSGSRPNPWTVLSNTEQWISTTLLNSNAATGGGMGQNPYSRKEVSYVCEASSDSAIIVANLFRRVKEARELGESHGQQEMDRAQQAGSSYHPSTLRQTQVVVIPANDVLKSNFTVFNDMVLAINDARRSARDYVTEAHWDRLDAEEDEDDDDDKEWSVAVNCAHLHPKFGEQTTQEKIDAEREEMKQLDEGKEIDVHYQEFLKRRVLARQSPYPTVVLEVRATPSPDFGGAATSSGTSSSSSAAKTNQPDSSEGVTTADILKLEQLFGKSAHMNHPTQHTTKRQEEEAFYSAIGKETDLQELSAVSPLTLAQNYMARADPTIPATAAFTESSTDTVDEAYEFLFTNIAMMAESVAQQQRQQERNDPPQQPLTNSNDIRHYVVFPNFVTSAATSLEKFAKQSQAILSTLPDLANRVEIETYHPEHVLETKRSPMPIILLRWNDF